MAKANSDKSELKLSVCEKCGCTDRTPYNNVRSKKIGGVTADGFEYNTVVWRHTKCANCGQSRDDKSFENQKEPASERQPKKKHSVSRTNNQPAKTEKTKTKLPK